MEVPVKSQIWVKKASWCTVCVQDHGRENTVKVCRVTVYLVAKVVKIQQLTCRHANIMFAHFMHGLFISVALPECRNDFDCNRGRCHFSEDDGTFFCTGCPAYATGYLCERKTNLQ